jgi:hypothetical protein
MTDQFSDADCLALVERSPAAVAVHDKSAWLALFARHNLVEDPVGSAPHVSASGEPGEGQDRLSPFYETFIAPNAIRFHVDRDCIRGLNVMRDLTIGINMSPRVTVRVPVHLLYELIAEEGELKIRRLAAHWELWPMLKQQMSAGWPFLMVGCASAGRMLRHLGPGGMLGFMRALSSVGEKGKAKVARFARCFGAGDRDGLADLFAGPDIEVAFSDSGPRLTIDELAALGEELRLAKVLAAGNVVTATVDCRGAGTRRRGVAVFELDRYSLLINALTFYWSAA